VSRRDQIKMTPEEADAFLEEHKTVTCATNGRDGFPHLMPLWYVLRNGRIWAWTYAKSQKVRNLERDPRATLQVETGVDYAELRGVMLRCDVEIHRDVDVVVDFAMDLVARYSGTGPEHDGAREAFRTQAPKRVALEFVERDRVTWDHRKLGGTY
jgi:PPOX class probable F420-dependent enzyme